MKRKGKFFLTLLMAAVMLAAVVPSVAFAEGALPDADQNGTITLVQDVTLTEDVTLEAGQTLSAGDYKITGDGYKITLEVGAKVTGSASNDLYEVLAGADNYYVVYTETEDTRSYLLSDVLEDGYNIFMAGHPTVIEQYGDNPEDLLISYTEDGSTYYMRYVSGNGCAAVVYGGVKNKVVDGMETSLTLKSGQLAAMVAGSKISSYDNNGNKTLASNGSIKSAVINIEGGSVVGDALCSNQPYKDQGMVMGIWYWGPDIESFTFNMTGGKVVGQVFGGSASNSHKNANYEAMTVENFTANISGGMITGDLFAGALDENTAENSTQTVKNAVINISNDASITNVYGGGFANWSGALTVVEKSEINMDGGTVGIIYGGGQNGLETQYNNSATSRVDDVTINVNDGEVTDVYGGGYNFHWNNSYWVADDGNVIKVNYKGEPLNEMIHYSDVVVSTININGGTIYGEVSLGGRSWAHVGTATANINADVDSVSGLGNYGYVESSTINVKEGAAVGKLDLVRSGIVGSSYVNNSGSIGTLIAGAPEDRYVENMGVNKIGVLNDVIINNNGTVDEAQLTYGLELANKVTSNVELVTTSVKYGTEKEGSSDSFQPEESSDWSGTTVVLGAGTTFKKAETGAAPIIQLSDGTVLEPDDDGIYTGKAAKVGDVYYDDIIDAFENAGDGEKVTLMSDVTLTGEGTYMDGSNKSFYQFADDKDIIFELNGFTLTLNSIGQMYDTNGGIEVLNGSLTIQDSRGGGEITGTSRWGGGALVYAGGTADSYGTVTLKSGTLSLQTEVYETHVGCNNSVVRIKEGGVFNMEGGAIRTYDADSGSSNYSSGGVFNMGGTATLSGGSIVTKGDETMGVYVNAETNLNGTNIDSEAYAVKVNNGAVKITDGLISSGKGSVSFDEDASGSAVITGGTISDKSGKPIDMEQAGAVAAAAVSGGTFSDSVSGYASEDAKYELERGSGESFSYFKTIEEVQLNIQPGDRVTAINVPQDTEVYTVILKFNDKTTDDMEYMVAEGTKLILPDPSREGYDFDDWNDDGTRYRGGAEYTVSGNAVLNARWETVPDDDDGGTAAASYSIGIAAGIQNGEIKLSAVRASKGTDVTVTAVPYAGYRLDSLTVTDADGKVQKLTDKGSGKYSFSMPASEVKVTAVFVKAVSNPFADVSSTDYYYDAVLWAVENGITNGMSDTSFGPDMAVTRAQMVTFLWRAAGSPKAEIANSFADVSSADYYYDAVLWAAANGITNGTSDTMFSPDMIVTRAQAVTFQYREMA